MIPLYNIQTIYFPSKLSCYPTNSSSHLSMYIYSHASPSSSSSAAAMRLAFAPDSATQFQKGVSVRVIGIGIEVMVKWIEESFPGPLKWPQKVAMGIADTSTSCLQPVPLTFHNEVDSTW